VDVVDFAERGALPFEGAADLAFQGDHAGGEIGVRHQQDLGGRRVSRYDLPHNALGRHHSHSALHAGNGSAIHEYHFGVSRRAHPDDACGHRFGGRARLENLKGFCAFRRVQFVLEEDVLELQAVQFRAQPPVLGASVVQQDVIPDHSGSSTPEAFKDARHRRHGGHGPHTDYAHVLIVFHLHGEQGELRENHQQQNGDVPVAI
jgi:hypothetical protein